MITKIRPITQLLFLGVFVILMITGKAQFWMGFIFLSIFLSAFLGRFYCGFACPSNTMLYKFIK
jgi:polyferredoxin